MRLGWGALNKCVVHLYFYQFHNDASSAEYWELHQAFTRCPGTSFHGISSQKSASALSVYLAAYQATYICLASSPPLSLRPDGGQLYGLLQCAFHWTSVPIHREIAVDPKCGCASLRGLRKCDHATSTMKSELHWLRIPERINFKLSTLVYKALQGEGPAYLRELCIPVGDSFHLSSHRSVDRGDLLARELTRRHMASVLLWLLALLLGTLFRSRSANLNPWLFFNRAWRLIRFLSRILETEFDIFVHWLYRIYRFYDVV